MEDAGEPSFSDSRGEFNVSGSASTAYATSDHGPEPSHTTQEENDPEVALLHDCNNSESPLQRHFDNGAPSKFATDTKSWLGDLDVDVDELVHPYDLPSFEKATQLLRIYLTTIHDWLPILPASFQDQVRRYYEHPVPVPHKWKATLNLVFAISARYHHLTCGNNDSAGGRGDEDVTYMSRAMQLLAVDSSAILTSTPDLPLIQVSPCDILLSIYSDCDRRLDYFQSTICRLAT